MTTVRVAAFDHLVLNVADAEVSARWYQEKLGLEPVRLAELKRCLDDGYRADGCRRITTVQQLEELVGEIAGFARKLGMAGVGASRLERERAFVREHECAEWCE